MIFSGTDEETLMNGMGFAKEKARETESTILCE